MDCQYKGISFDASSSFDDNISDDDILDLINLFGTVDEKVLSANKSSSRVLYAVGEKGKICW